MEDDGHDDHEGFATKITRITKLNPVARPPV